MSEEDKQEQEEGQEPEAGDQAEAPEAAEEAPEPEAPEKPAEPEAAKPEPAEKLWPSRPTQPRPPPEAKPRRRTAVSWARRSGAGWSARVPPAHPVRPARLSSGRANGTSSAALPSSAAGLTGPRADASAASPGHRNPAAPRQPGAKKVRQGIVVSAGGEKTITVEIAVVRRHRTYEKVVRRTTKQHAHDEANQAQQGDIVRIIESRPLSRSKRWRLLEVLERAPR